METVDALMTRLRAAAPSAREAVKREILSLAQGAQGRAVREHLESLKRGELLEIQWEIEEILDASSPAPATAPAPAAPAPAAAQPDAPEATPQEVPPPPGRGVSPKDLVTVYDDPRGLMLHKTKAGDRWFATQADPYTGQPQTFELRPSDVAQLKTQLARSPYWVIGAGGVGA